MPLETTEKAIDAILRADPSVTPLARKDFLTALRHGPTKAEPTTERASRILRRAEVARRLSCSLRTVDKLPVKKVKLPGRQRAAGFLESDINALLAV